MPNSAIWRFASTNLPHFKIKTIFGKFQKKLHHSYLLKYVSIKRNPYRIVSQEKSFKLAINVSLQ